MANLLEKYENIIENRNENVSGGFKEGDYFVLENINDYHIKCNLLLASPTVDISTK